MFVEQVITLNNFYNSKQQSYLLIMISSLTARKSLLITGNAEAT